MPAIARRLAGNAVAPGAASGVIVPASESAPSPTNPASYTQDWFAFKSDGVNQIVLTAIDGTNFLTPSVADGVGTLRSTLAVFDAVGTQVGSDGVEAADTLSETYAATLPAGVYYARIASFGGHVQDSPPGVNGATYYDMGAYFLTGTGLVAVPEPATLALLLALAIAALASRHRRAVA